MLKVLLFRTDKCKNVPPKVLVIFFNGLINIQRALILSLRRLETSRILNKAMIWPSNLLKYVDLMFVILTVKFSFHFPHLNFWILICSLQSSFKLNFSGSGFIFSGTQALPHSAII